MGKLWDFTVNTLFVYLGRCLDCLWRRRVGGVFCAKCEAAFYERTRRLEDG